MAAFIRISGSTAVPTGPACNWTKSPFPSCWLGACGKANALGEFDPHLTISSACTYLIRKGPATAEERWEEAGGYSPSTLASNIAALVCAAEMFEARGDKHTADFLRTY